MNKSETHTKHKLTNKRNKQRKIENENNKMKN